MFYVLQVRDTFGYVESVLCSDKSLPWERKTLRENYPSGDGYRIVKKSFDDYDAAMAYEESLNG